MVPKSHGMTNEQRSSMCHWLSETGRDVTDSSLARLVFVPAQRIIYFVCEQVEVDS